MRLVIVESPYAGHAPRWTRALPPVAWLIRTLRRWRNVLYARAAVRHSLLLGEAPIASHLLYTQPGILRDEVPGEREHGIAAGLAWGWRADATVIYTDLGISGGMRFGVARAERDGRSIEYRSIPAWRPLREPPLAPVVIVIAILLAIAAGIALGLP